jgi:hypothetical protein
MTSTTICNISTNKNSPERTLSFPNGLFHGKEAALRITDDSKWVSVWDVIKMVGEQKDPYKIWERIDKTEVQSFCRNLKFKGSGQRETPCVNAKGLVLLLMQIPGEKAKQFRLAGADILVRYLGGDTTLINDIEAINDTHNSNPENQASFFRSSETVQNNIFSQELEIKKLELEELKESHKYELCIVKENNYLELEKSKNELEKARELTKQKQLEFETKKIELEMLKIKSQKEQPKEPKDVQKDDKIFIWCKNNIQHKDGEVIRLSELYKRYTRESGELDSRSKSELKIQVEKYLGAPVKSSSHHGATYQGWKNVTLK